MTVTDVPGLLRALLTDDPGRPRLTWYGPGGERVELSAKVLDNWVAKTANLLVDDLDAGPGHRIALALPAHWRTCTWLLAVWSVGACAVTVPPTGPVPDGVDVVVSADPAVLFAVRQRATPVAVALPALATSFDGELPLGAVDAATDVRAHGDVFVTWVNPEADDPALALPDRTILYGDLVAGAVRAADAAGLPPRVRLLTGAGPTDAVSGLLAPLVRLGSVVLHHDLAGADPADLERLRRQEAVTSPSE